MKRIVLLALLILLPGCTLVTRKSVSTPPRNVPTNSALPQGSNGAIANGGAQDGEVSTIVFRNQRYNYSLKIPQGWGMAESNPVNGKPALPIKDSAVQEITFSQPNKDLEGNMVAIFAYYNPERQTTYGAYCNKKATTDRVSIGDVTFDREQGLTSGGKLGGPRYPFECLITTVHGVQYFLYQEGDSSDGRSLLRSFNLIDGSGLWNEFRDSRTDSVISFQYPKRWHTSTDLQSEVVVALSDPDAKPETWPNFIIEYEPNGKKLTLDSWYQKSFWQTGRIGVDEELTVTDTRGYKLATSTNPNPRYIFVGPSTTAAPYGEYLITITTDMIDNDVLEYILGTLSIRQR